MKDKNYYIPKIEELHPGMEIEMFYQKGKLNLTDGKVEFIASEPEKKWHKEIISTSEKDTYFWNHPIGKLAEIIDKKLLRIKHLDKDDFNSLGWKSTLRLEGKVDYKEFSDYKNIRENDIKLLYMEQSKHVLIYVIDGIEAQTIVAGTIQNISELKVIIKQLEIKPNE